MNDPHRPRATEVGTGPGLQSTRSLLRPLGRSESHARGAPAQSFRPAYDPSRGGRLCSRGTRGEPTAGSAVSRSQDSLALVQARAPRPGGILHCCSRGFVFAASRPATTPRVLDDVAAGVRVGLAHAHGASLVSQADSKGEGSKGHGGGLLRVAPVSGHSQLIDRGVDSFRNSGRICQKSADSRRTVAPQGQVASACVRRAVAGRCVRMRPARQAPAFLGLSAGVARLLPTRVRGTAARSTARFVEK